MSVSNLENKSALYFYKGQDVETLRSCHEEEIWDINEKGYDIFWTLNEFKDGRRTKENLEKINYVVADFDRISSNEFFQTIRNNPKPTIVIATRSGFHAYWKTVGTEGINPDLYREFVSERIVPLGADENAKDVCRILRVPLSRYWQDSKGNRYEDQEIRCEVIYDDGPEWKWEQLKRLFRKVRTVGGLERAEPRGVSTERIGDGSGNNFWSKCNAVPVEQGILRLSGASAVKGQRLTLKSEGKIKRLLVDGRPSNGWVDPNGRFGSTYENTAGTLVNFLKFPEYGLSNADIAKVFKEEFGING